MVATRWNILKKLLCVMLPMYPQVIVGLFSNLWGGYLVARCCSVQDLAGYAVSVVVTQQSGFSLIWGGSSAVLTQNAQSYGAKAFHDVGISLQRGVLVLSLFVCVPLTVVFVFSDELMILIGQGDVASTVRDFARIRVPALFFCALAQCVIKTVTAISRTHYAFEAIVISCGVNLILSVFLVPNIGVNGAAVASLCSDGALAVVVWVRAWQDSEFKRCWPGWSGEALRGWCAFLRLAVPGMFLFGFEVAVWDVQTILAGYISPLAQATQGVVPQFCCLMYAFGQAMANANGSVIGSFLGEGNGPSARRTVGVTLSFSFKVMLLQGLIFWLLHSRVPHWYTDRPDLITSMTDLLPFCVVFSFLDGSQASVTGIFVGLGWQEVGLPIVLVCYWLIAVPCGIFLAFRGVRSLGIPWLTGGPMHLEGLWTGMLIGVSLHLLIFVIMVSFVNWEKEARKVNDLVLKKDETLVTQLETPLETTLETPLVTPPPVDVDCEEPKCEVHSECQPRTPRSEVPQVQYLDQFPRFLVTCLGRCKG